jgi:hypothetical protein
VTKRENDLVARAGGERKTKGKIMCGNVKPTPIDRDEEIEVLVIKGG